MRVAIMQPYFFPYLGYFSLIKEADLFILGDMVQFQRKSWITRNRILNEEGDVFFINIPTKKMPINTDISQIEINHNVDWKKRLLKQLLVYNKAPFYEDTLKVINKILDYETNSLVRFHQYGLQVIVDYLGIEREIILFSDMGISIEPATVSDEWALNISKKIGAKEYINPPGGVTLYSKDKYLANNVQLTFLQNNLPPYKQFQSNFVPGLSIIDVMMFNSRDSILTMIEDTKIIEPNLQYIGTGTEMML